MIVAPHHPREAERLELLDRLTILDTLSEQEYDDLTHLASTICDAPISLVSLVDEKRQWFKSKHGLDAPETPRELAFCAHAILDDAMLVVPDSLKDERFHDNPLATGAPNVRFYAGIPIKIRSLPMGTLCVIDNRPRELDDRARSALEALGRQVESLLNLRLTLRELRQAQQSRNAAIEQAAVARGKSEFAAEILHDIGNAISGLEARVSAMRHDLSWTELEMLRRAHQLIESEAVGISDAIGDGRGQQLASLIESVAVDLDARQGRMADVVVQGSTTVNKVSEILALQREHARSVEGGPRQQVHISQLVADALVITDGLLAEHGVDLHRAIPEDLPPISGDRTQLSRVLINGIKKLLAASRGAEMSGRSLRIVAQNTDAGIRIRLSDNGPGFAPGGAEVFFAGPDDGGLGLATCARVASSHGGSFEVASDGLGKGARISLTLPAAPTS